MTEVVPWVPYLWPNNVLIIGPKVTHWNYDQFTDGPAYAGVRQAVTGRDRRGGTTVSRPHHQANRRKP